MEVGVKISDYLKSKGISQVHVSRETGISASKLNLVLAGKRRLSIADYELICGALEVPVDTFLNPRLPNRKEGESHES